VGRKYIPPRFAITTTARHAPLRFLFPLKVALDAGQYTLRARVDIGNGEIQEGKAVVSANLPKK
jgi:hypothetical protein